VAPALTETVGHVGRALLGALRHQAGWWQEVGDEVPELAAAASRRRPQVQLEFFPRTAIEDEAFGAGRGETANGDPDAVVHGVATRRAFNDLELRFVEGDVVRCGIRYRPDLWSAAAVDELFAHLRRASRETSSRTGR
jgi:hypothetical protein